VCEGITQLWLPLMAERVLCTNQKQLEQEASRHMPSLDPKVTRIGVYLPACDWMMIAGLSTADKAVLP
jgi:hypothetical protein